MRNVIEYLPLLSRGFALTVGLALLSLALATVLGGLACAGRVIGGPVARAAVLVYTTIVRGVPDLVMLLLIYFGGQRLVNLVASALGLGQISVSPFLAGVIAIGFIYGAYLAETFRGAYLAIPRGQVEAASALGLRGWPLFARVVLPQLARFALPGYGNTWQVLVKSTAVVSVIGLRDIVGLAGDAGKSVRDPFTFFVVVLGAYLLITWSSTQALDAAARRVNRGYADAR